MPRSPKYTKPAPRSSSSQNAESRRAKKQESTSKQGGDEAPGSTAMSLPNARKASRLEKQALERLNAAKSIVVKDVPGYRIAGDFVVSCREAERAIEELFNPHITAAHKLHKGLCDDRKRLTGPLVDARRIVERSMSDYDLAQRKLAELEAEKKAQAEREVEIKEAKKLKDKELIETLKSMPLDPVEVPVTTPKVNGVISKKVIKWRFLDESLIPRKFLVPDEKAISDYVRAHGLSADIAGIEVYEDVQTQVRV